MKRPLLIGLAILVVAGLVVVVGTMMDGEHSSLSWDGDATFIIEGNPVTLRNGAVTAPLVPGSDAVRTVKVWSVFASGDLNGDGKSDMALILTDDAEGSGTFYYLAAALSLPFGGFQGTNAIFMGDRVAPQNVAIEDGWAVANYADRAPDEPFSAQPSIGKTLRAMVVGGALLIDSTKEHIDRIRIETPQPGARITSPLAVKGAARGTWYFEASFPVELRAYDGTILAQVPAQAQGEWMMEEFVPFSVTLTFPAQPSGSTGVLILHKDNPSGEAKFDDQVVLPVLF